MLSIFAANLATASKVAPAAVMADIAENAEVAHKYFMGNEKALVKFISVREILNSKNIERVRIGGVVADSSIIVSPSNRMEVYFNIKEGTSILPVKFVGTRPDLFKHGAEVIVEGAYSNGSFNADMLQTKCASRYEGDLRDASSYKLDDINI